MQGIKQLTDIDIREIIPVINWKSFFRVWKMSGKYDGIGTFDDETTWLNQFPETDRAKANEALKLFRDAQKMLCRFLDEKIIRANAVFGILPACSDGNDIIIKNGLQKTVIPTLRQQQPSNDGFCYSLADFLHEKDDFIGVFSCTILGADEFSAQFEQENDVYNALLVSSLADRLVEATSEWLHFQARKSFLSIHFDEVFDVERLLKNQYPGIRPAVGYPSLPDQSIIFDLNSILKFDENGIKLTENGAMSPASSVCGLYFFHPKSKYFIVGKIDEIQLVDYASRRGKTMDEMGKWLNVDNSTEIAPFEIYLKKSFSY